MVSEGERAPLLLDFDSVRMQRGKAACRIAHIEQQVMDTVSVFIQIVLPAGGAFQRLDDL